METGDSGGTKFVVDTVSDSCACSPLGKVKQVSRPHAPGAAVYWTTYTYDALGRTTRVDLPGGGATTYSYDGNTVAITDPGGTRTWRAERPILAGPTEAVTIEPDL